LTILLEGNARKKEHPTKNWTQGIILQLDGFWREIILLGLDLGQTQVVG